MPGVGIGIGSAGVERRVNMNEMNDGRPAVTVLYHVRDVARVGHRDGGVDPVHQPVELKPVVIVVVIVVVSGGGGEVPARRSQSFGVRMYSQFGVSMHFQWSGRVGGG